MRLWCVDRRVGGICHDGERQRGDQSEQGSRSQPGPRAQSPRSEQATCAQAGE